MDKPSRVRFLGPLPATGPWSAVGLSRGAFLGIFLVSLLTFVFVGGPLWAHLRDPHFARVTVSYALIPVLVAVAQWRDGTLEPGPFLGASALLAAMKLLATAGLTVALGVAG